jgi:hypothetical protein
MIAPTNAVARPSTNAHSDVPVPPVRERLKRRAANRQSVSRASKRCPASIRIMDADETA